MSNSKTDNSLKEAYSLMESGQFDDAGQLLYESLEFDVDNMELHFAYWCCSFWGKTISTALQISANERGQLIFEHWIEFDEALERNKREDVAKTVLEKTRPATNPKALYATKIGVFTVALNSFKEAESLLTNDSATVSDKANIKKGLGLCNKEIGNYEASEAYFKEAYNLVPKSSEVLAGLADCFALSGKEKEAKLYFREAFFLDAQKIEIAFLDSQLIRSIVSMVKEKGYTKSSMLEWIPVYGEITRVFNIKHGISAQDLGKLKQDIYSRKNELKDPANSPQILVPKLINMYFRLIDYYEQSEDSSAAQRSFECQLEIRALDEEIYRLYTASR